MGPPTPPHRIAAILNHINHLAGTLKQDGDERTMDQIRADLLMDLLEGTPAYPAAHRGDVEIRVDLTTLLRLDDKAGEIPGWGPVIADVARQITELLHDGKWRFAVDLPDTDQPLTGITRRRPTASQRRHLQARNRTCSFPGCPTPATRCHLDHTVEYRRNGKTVHTNLGPLCARHHLRAKHRAGWRLSQPRPGHFHWISPRGHRYLVRPPPE